MRVEWQIIFHVLCFFYFGGIPSTFAEHEVRFSINRSVLPEIPTTFPENEKGHLSRYFLGTHNGTLIIAGGMLDGQDAVKVSSKILFLKEFSHFAKETSSDRVSDNSERRVINDTGSWSLAETELPRKSASGFSLSTDQGVLCIGGFSKNRELLRDVTLLRWNISESIVEVEELPEIPTPLVEIAAARDKDKVYLYGLGYSKTGELTNEFYSFNLSEWEENRDVYWKKLPPVDKVLLNLASVGVKGDTFYLFGASDYNSKEILNFSYRSDLGKDSKVSWSRVANVPQDAGKIVGAAIPIGATDFLFFTQGSRGSNEQRPPRLEGGSQALIYHSVTDTWTGWKNPNQDLLTLPASLVGDGLILAGDGSVETGMAENVVLYEVSTESARFSVVNWIVVSSYLLILILMGYYFSRREKTTDDYYTACGRIPWWAAALSLFATSVSSITFMSMPAKAFASDWVFSLYILGSIIYLPFVLYLVVPIVRRLKISTSYEYLEIRFNLASRVFGSGLFVCYVLARMGIVMFLPAIVLSTITGLDIYYCILLVGVVSTFYTMIGGIEAVIWSDVLQAVLFIGAAVWSFFVILGQLNGGVDQIVSVGIANDKFHMVNVSWDLAIASIWVIFLSKIFTPFSILTDQSMVQRMQATRDEIECRRAILGQFFVVVLSTFVFFSVGTALYVFYKLRPDELDPTLLSDSIFPYFIVTQLPNGFSGIMIAGVFAAAMSTLDSGMSAGSMVLVNDFIRRWKPATSDRVLLLIGKGLVCLFGSLSTLTAIWLVSRDVSSMWDVFIEITSLFSGGLLGLFMLGILTTQANGRGAICGVVVSTLIVFVVRHHTTMHFFLYEAIGASVCFAFGYLFSLFFPDTKSVRGLTAFSLDAGRD